MSDKKNILVVDDQGSIRLTVQQMLTQLGHAVKLAEDGNDALRVLEEYQNIDMILTDVDMKTMSGLEVLKTCHSTYPNTPLVLMSAYTKNEVIIDALRAGACDYLVKPIEIQQLSSVINRVDRVFSERRKVVRYQDIVSNMALDFILTSGTLVIEKLQLLIKSTVQLYTKMPITDLMNFSMAFEEALLNAHEHGNLELRSEWKEEFPPGQSESLFEKIKKERLQLNKYADRKLQIKLMLDRQKVVISIADEGKGFQRGSIATEASGKPYGMGLMLINNLCDLLFFSEAGNKITIEKNIKQI